MATPVRSDFLIIGSGIAGLYAAVRLAAHGHVSLVTKRGISDTNTRYAQGGIAAVHAEQDSFEKHMADTLEAGDGLCDVEVVRTIVREAPAKIQELIALGARFTCEEDGELELGREGGHTARRIVHAEDRTGEEVQRALTSAVSALPNVHVFEDHIAVDLILQSRAGGTRSRDAREDRCLGVFAMERGSHVVSSFIAPVTLLATGGVGKVYKFTSNPDVATGDGLAMAYRAGARLADLEFVQFHPTCLYHHVARSFLISEATRGEGAELTTIEGDAFMSRYDARAELAPRDIVARAIDTELKRRGDPHVLLHLEKLGAARVRQRFPQITERLMSVGIDCTLQPVPVVPAAHYMCGGVMTDLGARTDLPGLLAAGEVAHTGMHGANRLASNSLLEGIVMAGRAIESAVEDRDRFGVSAYEPRWDPGDAKRVEEAIILEHDWNNVRALMWDYVGIFRSEERLRVAGPRMQTLWGTINAHFRRYLLTPDLVELRNVALVGALIVRCARSRKESRGLHFTLDHPTHDDVRGPRSSIVCRNELEE